MTRTVIALALALALSSTAASADPVPRTVGDATPGAFIVETFGEAAERVQVAGKPLHMQVRIALPLDRVFPIDALHAYLKENGFDVVAETELKDSEPVPGKPLTLVGRKVAVVSRAEVDRHHEAVKSRVPEGVKIGWEFSVAN